MSDINKKRGTKLQDGKLHEADHIEFSRRRFIKSFGLAGGLGFVIGGLPISASALTRWSMPPILEKSERILIMIRLKGGNDGLHTIIPLDQLSAYHNARPDLGYQDNQMINLNDKIAMSPHLSKLKPLWDNGMMKVVLGAGYPEQNLSHFRSTDIWSSASDSDTLVKSGWVGRYIEEIYPDYVENTPIDPPAIQIGGGSSLLLTGENIDKVGFETFSADQIEEFAASGNVHSLDDIPDCSYGDQLKYVRILTNSTYKFIDTIKTAYENGPDSTLDYADRSFPQSMKIISTLIKGGLKTKIYIVELDGFDTHSTQIEDHEYLMNILGDTMANFMKEFEGTAHEENILAITFSEFGRRVEQNEGPGTDHGAASVMLAFGKSLEGNGTIGEHPSLTDVDDDGNMQFNVDFRKVYASLFTEWLCLDDPISDKILLKDFGDPLPFGFNCQEVSAVNEKPKSGFAHNASYGMGDVFINYTIPKDTMVMVELLSLSGQSIMLDRPMNKKAGTYSIPVKQQSRKLMPGAYIYRIRITGGEFTGKIVLN
ncbi:MAG: DUF1501 domain-containing protein [Saprospiraceae bacterium]|nr:DUF1501 domain-containing protein [Candidatus Brachybacter algidus]